MKTMFQVAVLIDAGYLLHELWRPLGNRYATADEVLGFARACLREEENLYRVYVYDCPPYAGTATNPIDQQPVDFAGTSTARSKSRLLDALAQMDYVALRLGVLGFRGWTVPEDRIAALRDERRGPRADEVTPSLLQKRVDIKIGLDVALLAMKRIVDKLILVTGDTDLVPALDFARREGLLVILATPSDRISGELRVHADAHRVVASDRA